MNLVIMAAGMGSRYGGLKQLDPIDENGNFIIDYSSVSSSSSKSNSRFSPQPGQIIEPSASIASLSWIVSPQLGQLTS